MLLIEELSAFERPSGLVMTMTLTFLPKVAELPVPFSQEMHFWKISVTSTFQPTTFKT